MEKVFFKLVSVRFFHIFYFKEKENNALYFLGSRTAHSNGSGKKSGIVTETLQNEILIPIDT